MSPLSLRVRPVKGQIMQLRAPLGRGAVVRVTGCGMKYAFIEDLDGTNARQVHFTGLVPVAEPEKAAAKKVAKTDGPRPSMEDLDTEFLGGLSAR